MTEVSDKAASPMDAASADAPQEARLLHDTNTCPDEDCFACIQGCLGCHHKYVRTIDGYCARCVEAEAWRDKPSVPDEPLTAYDLRLRSIDRQHGDPMNLCTECEGRSFAHWSVWLHVPGWGARGGLTRVVCTIHALEMVSMEAHRARI